MRAPLLALPLLAACGETVSVPIALSLDPASCSTREPDSVVLSCTTAVGLWVRRASDGEPLLEACVDLPGEERTLAALPPLLSSVDLGAVDERDVVLELAVYTPASAAAGCAPLAEGVDEMVVWGSQAIDLGEADRPVLELGCRDLDDDEDEDDGQPEPACAAACEQAHDVCQSDGGMIACQSAHGECVQSCAADSDCIDWCEDELEECLSFGGGDRACDLRQHACLVSCGDDEGECVEDCWDEYSRCEEIGPCAVRREDCLDQCPRVAAPLECASVR